MRDTTKDEPLLTQRGEGLRNGGQGKQIGVRQEKRFQLLMTNSGVLNSWKEIATYLGRGVLVTSHLGPR